jgi:hypothetical protein
MGQTLTGALLVFENATYHGTSGVSENNRCLGFQPAFIEREAGAVYLSRIRNVTHDRDTSVRCLRRMTFHM